MSIQCQSGCSDEDYDFGYSSCDEIYGNSANTRPTRPGGFVAPSNNVMTLPNQR